MAIATVGTPSTELEGQYAPDLVLAFALSVGKPGGQALLINSDNTRDRWVPRAEAVRLRRPFVVEVAEDVLAVDCDRPELEPHVRRLAHQLRLDGLRPVLLASGRPGHFHIFCRIRDSSLLGRYRDRVRELKLDPRNAIRPPLAAHRLGLPVVLLDPDDPAEALAALNLGRPSNPPLSERMRDLLRWGDRDGRYLHTGKRSSVVMALVTAMVNARWSFDESFCALRDPDNRGGEKVQERNERAAHRYVAACWAKAQAKVAGHPTIGDRAAALRVIGKVQAAVEAHVWKGVTGATDRRVMAAHLRISLHTGKVVYGAAVRTVAELAGCGLETVCKSHVRLRHIGWLKLVAGAKWRDTKANIWSLRIPKQHVPEPNSHITSPSQQNDMNRNSQIPPTGGDERDCAVSYSPTGGPHHDVWRRGALGGSAWRIWGALDPCMWRSTREIAERVRLERQTVRNHLTRLARYGLSIRCTGGRWRRGDAELEDVARQLGVAGKGEQQQRRHDDERLAHRMRIACRTGVRV